MSESKENTSLLTVPSTEQDRPKSTDDTEDASSVKHPLFPERRRLGLRVFIKNSAILSLSALTLLTGGVSAMSLLQEHESAPYPFTRLLLGDVFGGRDNVLVLEQSILPPENTLSDKAESALPMENHPALPSEGERDMDGIVHKILSSSDRDFSNETPYAPDVEALLKSPPAIKSASALYEIYGEQSPLVLILHTHGTEAYSDSAQSDFRSTDSEKNVLSCGALIAKILQEHGIAALHCTTLFDEEDFTMAYYNASLHVRSILEEYPSVSYVLDVHRDSISIDGSTVAPTVETEEGPAAQMMFVVGTNHGGADHESWEDNLSLALRLQAELNKSTPQLMRNINLRSASFNQQYSSGALLLEIGAGGSSLTEAHRSAALFAHAFAREILGGEITPQT